MRKVITEPSFPGSTDIGAIELDAKSRDDIPALLIGLQAICLDEATRRELFHLLDAHILPGRRRTTGRPGMDLWRILAVGVLQQGLRCDFDRLREIADRHADVQTFPGHDVWFDPCRYELRTIRDNVSLPVPELLGKAGDLVVGTGHKVAGKKPGAALVGRCGSFVVETDVHYPTDVNLLRDSALRLVREASRACGSFGVPGWRQRRHWERTVGELSDAVRTASSQRSRPDAVRACLKACLKLAGKAAGLLEALKRAGCPEPVLDEIGRLAAHVRRFADQIKRRVLLGKKIPHGEKVFSIFEEHTRWISKGKAGKKVEFGVPVCIVEDGNGFVLGREILWTGGDADVAVPLVERCRKAFPDLRGAASTGASTARRTERSSTICWSRTPCRRRAGCRPPSAGARRIRPSRRPGASTPGWSRRSTAWSTAVWTGSGCAARTGSSGRSASPSSPPTSTGCYYRVKTPRKRRSRIPQSRGCEFVPGGMPPGTKAVQNPIRFFCRRRQSGDQTSVSRP